jgi:hypothetical protein
MLDNEQKNQNQPHEQYAECDPGDRYVEQNVHDRGPPRWPSTDLQSCPPRYGKLAIEQGNPKDCRAWFEQHRAELESQPGLSVFAQVAALHVLSEYERDPSSMEALGALNRWRGRSAIALEKYFGAWEKSCRKLQASADLPTRLRNLLGLTARHPELFETLNEAVAFAHSLGVALRRTVSRVLEHH